MRKKIFWTDEIHGFTAYAATRSSAWMLIRNECRERGLKVPLMEQVTQVNKSTP